MYCILYLLGQTLHLESCHTWLVSQWITKLWVCMNTVFKYLVVIAFEYGTTSIIHTKLINAMAFNQVNIVYLFTFQQKNFVVFQSHCVKYCCIHTVTRHKTSAILSHHLRKTQNFSSVKYSLFMVYHSTTILLPYNV